eukprot:scaffold89555_cov26-Tisochrysis_lutea.AAC.1
MLTHSLHFELTTSTKERIISGNCAMKAAQSNEKTIQQQPFHTFYHCRMLCWASEGKCMKCIHMDLANPANSKLVGVVHADIKNFTAMSRAISSVEVMHFLNTLFSQFDDLVDSMEHLGLYKVETIGGCLYITLLSEFQVVGLHGAPVAARAYVS